MRGGVVTGGGSPVGKGGLVSVDMTWSYAHLLQRGEWRDKERERIEYQCPPLGSLPLRSLHQRGP